MVDCSKKQLHYRDNIILCRTWYDNGHHLRTQETLKNGRKEGERKLWYVTGGLGEQEFYRFGKLEGLFKLWHDNGVPYIQTSYRGNKIEGERKILYNTGNIYTWMFYQHDAVVDMRFTWKKKLAILRLKKLLHSRDVYRISTFLISDLDNIV